MTPPVHLSEYSIVATAAPDLSIAPVLTVNSTMYIVPIGGEVKVPKSCLPAYVDYHYRDSEGHDPEPVYFACGADFDGDSNCGTDADIESFFAAYAAADGGDLSADFDESGAVDWRDASAFFTALAGG